MAKLSESQIKANDFIKTEQIKKDIIRTEKK